MMRDFQASINSGNQPSSDDWNMLIDTSYMFLNVAQCPSGTGLGLVPNWALVQESTDGMSLEARSGSFSGSGTPQYEFGAEASRTMWRVAFDALAYPDESAAQAVPFLDPLNTKLVESFDPNALNGVIFPSDSVSNSFSTFTIPEFCSLLCSTWHPLFSSNHVLLLYPVFLDHGSGMVSCLDRF